MMLGHYHYYIDAPDDGHDCMWSGDCCQALMTTTVTQTAVEATATLAPACVMPAESTTTETLTMTTATVTTTTTTTAAKTDSASPAIEDTLEAAVATSTTSADTTVAANTRQGSRKSSTRQQHQQYNQKPDQQQLHNRGERNEASRGLQVANKKLRHREVEKNRHRQLQAMVKNISERIPGQLDKETQVQTMKRAARYCLYLRDIMNSLNHGQAQLQLQKVYLKAYESVELMSQC